MSIQRQKAKDKSIDFEVVFRGISLTGDSRDIESSPIIRCDEQRIMQVLLGLQTNALKFTKKGKVTTKVEILEADQDQN